MAGAKKRLCGFIVKNYAEVGMKIKKEYIILTAVIAALVLYLAFRKTDRAHYELPDIPKIDGKTITKLELENAGKTTVLNKKDATWHLGPEAYPADTKTVDDMLEVIASLAVTALVSESENYVRYDLNEKKIAVKAWAGETLKREFDIGKPASTYQHTFVRLKGDPNVYHARGYFRRQFDHTADDLRDKTVLSFKKDDITEIEVLTEGKTIAISRKEASETKDTDKDASKKPADDAAKKTVWQTADGKTAETEVVEKFISYFSDLACEGYIEGTKKEDFKDPVHSITLKGDSEHSLSVFSKNNPDEKDNPAVSSQNAYPFLLSDSKIDYIKKSITDMFQSEGKKQDGKGQ